MFALPHLISLTLAQLKVWWHRLCRCHFLVLAISSSLARKGGQTMAKILSFRWNRNQKVKPMCLVCLEPLSAMTDFNLCNHYNSLQKNKKYTEAARTPTIANSNQKYTDNITLSTQLQPHRRLHPRHLLLCSSLVKLRNLFGDTKKVGYGLFVSLHNDLEERQDVMISAYW